MLPSDRIPRMRIVTLTLAIFAYFILIITLNTTPPFTQSCTAFALPSYDPSSRFILPQQPGAYSPPIYVRSSVRPSSRFLGTEFMDPCTCSVVNHHCDP